MPTDRDLILQARRGDANGRGAFGNLSRATRPVSLMSVIAFYERGEAGDWLRNLLARA
ncbi:hypothetical protein [Candidatus Villigracilis proximus]|uniref:hypothetical protein n=1 Tax=Candidatus Villigracilis proximus TaxID=3140683 RepID=UPI0031E9E2BB